MTEAIRLAEPRDRPAVEALVRAAYGHYVARIGATPGPMRDDYGALIAAGRVRVVDRDAGGLAGLLVLIPQPDAMLLDNVAVAPEAQGKGLGRRLIAFAEQAARAAGYAVVRLYTHETMVENIALYGRLGFRETRRATELGLRRVYMEKRLS